MFERLIVKAPGSEEQLLGAGMRPAGPSRGRVPVGKQRETTMNWNWFRLDWAHFRDDVRDNWRKLTDEDLTRIAGRRGQLIGRLQARYGFVKAEAEREAEDWMRAQAARPQRRGGPAAWRGASHRFGATYSW